MKPHKKWPFCNNTRLQNCFNGFWWGFFFLLQGAFGGRKGLVVLCKHLWPRSLSLNGPKPKGQRCLWTCCGQLMYVCCFYIYFFFFLGRSGLNWFFGGNIKIGSPNFTCNKFNSMSQKEEIILYSQLFGQKKLYKIDLN